MRPRRTLIIATGLAALAGCTKTQGSGDDDAPNPAQNVARACKDVDPGRMPGAGAATPRGGYTKLAERDSLLRLIDAGENKWRAARPAGYTITVVASCFCRDGGLPVILRVVADSVVASRDTTGQQSWAPDRGAGREVAGHFR
jgi:hypothetical protein